ncbi:MAG: PLP-dependent aminotransferase family protein [Flavobacteriia bacterium]|nr:PLP-dependent aminotransferase family protein [Flavobacteriia bacterium]OIP46009.1 MAG: GntR family transcriptional regulator [Flavobacteriaceae bacterium CG2_30_31_66]PIV95849.1 MAG: GntR family transcriptional regulator [Flavobacteriaceae bacterium CG17_big_fil_post_rev_8_21_14_2_50_31_13]PIX13995.1 MAG: GntR family transcriptional regulator [Flavobacteriaceae bacterium CG_4_8_14_3_um_filter_31_8]PIY15334.1 MAG: GntR family transcriptional regulator [Flavobacteriaceae bacterium CG_4_10_14_
MNTSPDFDFFSQLILLDKSVSNPLYIQVSQQIINAIQRNYFAKGTILPGTRLLSKLLKVHRNTAVAIYNELASQGWVEIVPNKGTFVLEIAQKNTKIKASSQKINEANTYANFTGFPFQKSFHLSPTEHFSNAQYVINEGKPDLRLHPVNEFNRWFSAAMKRKTLPKKWNKKTGASFSVFQTQLCNYLNATRGFRILPENILNTRSTEMSLYIVSQLLIKKNELVLVGNLSNYASNMIFQEAGAIIKTIPVDAEGLDIAFIKKNFENQPIRCVYICANRDYPTTVKLSAERRLQLLELAKEFGFAIIEDDYDYDFQFEGNAILPLASADANGMVIYLGKLGQSLFPSFQTGFVVAPENLISEAKNYLQLLDKQGDLIQEQMLSELIHEGEIHRLMKKNSVVYKKRQEVFCKHLETYFKNIISWEKPLGGLAIWLQFPSKIPLLQLAEEAEKQDLFLPKTILYQDKITCAIRFGFGHLNEEEIEIVVKKLKDAYEMVLKK